MTSWRKIKTEGLPEERKTVLWLMKDGMVRTGHLYDGSVTWEYRWQPIKAFTHWMPLPKPPKD